MHFQDSKHPDFRTVIEGMDVVDVMAKVKMAAYHKPEKDVKIECAKVTG